MRILIFANYDEGLYKFRKELLESLIVSNEIFISVPEGKYIEKIESIGCKVIKTEFNRRGTNPIKDLVLVKKYLSIIDKVNPDVVFTYTIKPNVYGGIACQIKKVPYLVNITGLGSALENGGILQKITIALYKIGLRKANKVFFQNNSNLEFMLNKRIVKDNYDLLPGSGVNLEHYKLQDYPNTNEINFVYVGRVMKQKGFDEYIEAAKYITQKYQNTRFHICGWYEDDYREIIDRLVEDNVVIYHGRVNDMADIYKDMHCTILPTYYPEGLSNVLLESLASARPIITTDRPGCKEVVDDGINGYVVEKQNSKDLIEKIEKFINLSYEDKKQLGINGRRKVEQHFNRNIVIDKYTKTIAEL